MPRIVKISPIHGLSVSYALEGELVTVQLSGFYSTEDGEQFINFAEQLTNNLTGYLEELEIRASQIDNLLISFDKEGNGTLYCNEFSYIVMLRAKKELKAGQGLTADDILDIEEVHLTIGGDPVIPPKDLAIIFIFSFGWRKGLYFNFAPLKSDNPEPLPDLAKLFGALFCRVLFQEKFRINEEQWARLIQWEWFPFSCLKQEEMRNLVGWSRQERYPAPFLETLCSNYKTRLSDRIGLWKKRRDLEGHGRFIDVAYRAYMDGDYIASIQTIMPRIEGLMRILLSKEGSIKKINQKSMVKNLVKSKSENSLLLPSRFQSYLLDCYFKGFDLAKDKLPLSRHTVGHGISRAEDYTFMRNTVLFMILDEILCFLPVS
jgi:hypothetical protein